MAVSSIEQQFVEAVSDLTLFSEDKSLISKLEQIWPKLDSLAEKYGTSFDEKSEGIEPIALVHHLQFEKWAKHSYLECDENGPLVDFSKAKTVLEQFISDLKNLACVIKKTTEDISDIVLEQVELEILQYLLEQPGTVRYQQDICGAVKRSRGTVGKKYLPKLMISQLIKHPENRTQGYLITPKGQNFINNHSLSCNCT